MRLSDIDVAGLAILKKLEEYRCKIESGERTGGTNDHSIRMCQAIVAEYTQFKTRAEWVKEL